MSGMKKSSLAAFAAACATLLCSCGIIRETALKNDDAELWSFGQDLSFFSQYGVETLILSQGDSVVAVSPALQARVMTSSYGGSKGPSLGWINRVQLAFKKLDARKVQIGGEDRFWVGPQGGDFSIFFEDGALRSEENWKIPAFMSSEPWSLVGRNSHRAKFEKTAEFENAKGTKFRIKAEREISVLNRKHVSDVLGIEIPESVDMVAFQSFNKLTNLGEKPWTPDGGMLNISVQSCFNANRKTCAFVPYRPGDPSELGDIVRDNFFQTSGAGNSDGGLTVDPSFIKYRTDGKSLGAIGISALRSEGIALGFDEANSLLTVIIYIKPADRRAYLPSSWRRASGAFDGDAISVFNNGPAAGSNAPGAAYYEISTYSPALSLDAGKSQFHLQRTFHFHGSEYDLGLISYKLAGISIGQLRGVGK